VAVAATILAALIFGVVPAITRVRALALRPRRHRGQGASPGRQFVVVQTARPSCCWSDRAAGAQPQMLHGTRVDATDVMMMRVALPRSSYPTPATVLDFERRLVESLRTIPGVRGPASFVLPMIGSARAPRS
jgi:hypothetical protein